MGGRWEAIHHHPGRCIGPGIKLRSSWIWLDLVGSG